MSARPGGLWLRAAAVAIAAALACPVPAGAAYEWEQHLHGSDVRDLVATDDALWMATLSGLVRMDLADSSLTVFRRDPRGVPSDSVNALALDAEGNVWCGTASAGVAIRRAQGGWQFLRTFDGLPSERVLALTASGTSMFVGTGSGFAVFSGNDVSSCTVIDPCVDEMPSLIIESVLALDDETWFGTSAGVARQRDGVLESFSEGLPTSAAQALVRHDGDIWCGTSGGVYRLDAASGTWSLVEGATRTVTSSISDFLSTPDGLLAASPTGGPLRVYRWDGVDWVVQGTNFPPRGEPKSLAMDATGRIWVGTGDGVRAWDAGAGVWTPAVRVPGLVDARPIWSVAAVSSDEAWVGYRAPLAAHFDGEGWTAISDVSTGGGFERRDVQAVFVDRQGRTWFGHCCCQDPGCYADRLTRTPGGDEWARIPAMNTRAIASDGEGLVFFGSGAEDPSVVGEGLAIWSESFPDDSVFVVRDDDPDFRLSSNTVTALAMGPSGRLWIGHRTNGVDVWSYGADPFDPSDDSWQHLSQSATPAFVLISDAVLDMVGEGPRVWIATVAGVTLFENGTSRGSWGQSTLGNAFITAIDVTADGSAWAGRDAGIVRFVPNALGTYDREFYDFPELTSNGVNDIGTVGSTVWVATDRGLSVGRPGIDPGGGPGGERAGSAYPNPYQPRRHDGVRLVDVDVPVDGAVYDAAGGVVARFDDVQPGEVVWDGRVEEDGVRGSLAAPGLYAIVARGGTLTVVARVALVR